MHRQIAYEHAVNLYRDSISRTLGGRFRSPGGSVHAGQTAIP